MSQGFDGKYYENHAENSGQFKKETVRPKSDGEAKNAKKI